MFPLGKSKLLNKFYAVVRTLSFHANYNFNLIDLLVVNLVTFVLFMVPICVTNS